MCTFAEEDPSLMQKHKESHNVRSELKCLMCGSVLPSWQQAGSPIDDIPITIFFGVFFLLDSKKNCIIPSALVLTVWE